MYIFVDESGTFTLSPAQNAFCVVGAYVIPEAAQRDLKETLRRFKLFNGAGAADEIKRKHLTEPQYFSLLKSLAALNGIGLAVVTDSHLNQRCGWHKEGQAQKIEEYVPSMIYPEGKAAVQGRADAVRKLSDQEYVEFLCRSILVWDITRYATLYYVQRTPSTLGSFRWRFDQKAQKPNHFERTFSELTSSLNQTMSLTEPFTSLEGADYSHFEKFYRKGEPPAWLPLPEDTDPNNPMIDGGKIWYDNNKFVDSKTEPGVQVADLLVGGIAACLRGKFTDNEQAAALLGALLVVKPKGEPVLRLISLDGKDEPVNSEVATRVRIMARHAKPMLALNTLKRAG